MSSARSKQLRVKDLFFKGEGRGNGSSIDTGSIPTGHDGHEMSVQVYEFFIEDVKVIFIGSIKFIRKDTLNLLKRDAFNVLSILFQLAEGARFVPY